MPKKVFMMGRPEIFSGEVKLETNKIFYGESADFFASTIKANFKPGKYTLADFGGAGGELCTNILKLLPDYSFTVDVFDTDEKALARNSIAQKTYNTDLASVPVQNKTYDITIMRYVLQWNTLEEQELILKEISRITKGIAIIQHCGPGEVDKEVWRVHSNNFINNSGIARMKRKDYLYSSAEEVGSILKKMAVNYIRTQHRRVDGYTNIFIERYALTEEEGNLIRKLVGDYDYLFQIAWLFDFRNK